MVVATMPWGKAPKPYLRAASLLLLGCGELGTDQLSLSRNPSDFTPMVGYELAKEQAYAAFLLADGCPDVYAPMERSDAHRDTARKRAERAFGDIETAAYYKAAREPRGTAQIMVFDFLEKKRLSPYPGPEKTCQVAFEEMRNQTVIGTLLKKL